MTGVIVFNIIFVFIIAMIITLRVLLWRTMKDSIYHYRNVFFIAGILFLVTLNISLYIYLLSCLLQTKTLTMRYIFLEFVQFPKNFALVALPVLGIICLFVIISNLVLIRKEGFRIKNLWGVLLGLVFIGGTIAILIADKLAYDKILVPMGAGKNSISTVVVTYVMLFLLLLMVYAECFFLGTVVMAFVAAYQHPVHDKDFIIILGCKINKKGGLLPLLKGRTDRAVKYAWEQEIATGKKVCYVPSGGQGPDEVMSEGSAMELYLLSHGAEENEVFAEKESKNTYENFLFSKRLIDSINPDANVCFATTNYHMFRSGVLAREIGLNAEGISSKTKWYFWPNGFVREFVDLVFMHIKQHILVACILAVVCAVLGTLSYIFSIA